VAEFFRATAQHTEHRSWVFAATAADPGYIEAERLGADDVKAVRRDEQQVLLRNAEHRLDERVTGPVRLASLRRSFSLRRGCAENSSIGAVSSGAIGKLSADPPSFGSTCFFPIDWPLAPELPPSSIGPPKLPDCQPARQTPGTTRRAFATHADCSSPGRRASCQSVETAAVCSKCEDSGYQPEESDPVRFSGL
jgi:hypothetical protein